MRKLISVLLLSIVFSLTFSCRKAEVDHGANIARVSITSEISTIDPALSFDVVSGTIVYQMYETLFEYDYLKRPYTVKPLLAEEMPLIENNGRKYTIKIKKNIFYHDSPALPPGRTVKAQDFINQIKRLAFMPIGSTGWWLFDGKIKGINQFRKDAGNDMEKMFSLPVSGLKAIDDYTLVIELDAPYPQMLYSLCMAFTAPIPEEAIRFYKNDFSQNEVGTGPFYITDLNLNMAVKAKKFPKYHPMFYPSKGDRVANDLNLLNDANKQLPFLNEIHFTVIKEDQTRWLNFLSEKIDFIQLPKDNFVAAITPSGELTNELKQKNINFQVVPTLTYWWLSFNMRDPILGKNKLLRQAIAHAVHMEKYIQVFTNNVAQKANSIYPPGIPGYNPSKVLPYEYNLEKAKELMKKAGYPDGKGLPVFHYDVRGSSTLARQMAEFVESELKKVGIKIEIIINTFPAFLAKSRGGRLQFWQGGWVMDYPDAENTLQLLVTKNHSPGPNSSFYSNKKFDELFEKMKVMSDGAEKFEIMDEMERLVTDDLPWVMQYYARNYYLHHNRLKNFRHSDIINNYFKYLRVQEK